MRSVRVGKRRKIRRVQCLIISIVKLFTKLKHKVTQLKKQIRVLRIAYSDSRTPFYAKLLIGLTVGYLLSPIDLIPDFIPVLGLLDDLILVPILIAISTKSIPNKVLVDAREKLESIPERTKKKNWFFAVVVIFIWLLILYFVLESYGINYI